MPKNRIEPGLQDNGKVVSQSESRRENENTKRGASRDKISTLDDLLTDWERQYFKVKLIKGQVKVTCLFDLEVGEYNQTIENCAREIEQQEINKAKEKGRHKPNVNDDKFRDAVDVRLKRDYQDRIQNRLNEVYKLRKGEQR